MEEYSIIKNESNKIKSNFEDFVSIQEKKYEKVEMTISEIINKNIKINENFNDRKFEKK